MTMRTSPGRIGLTKIHGWAGLSIEVGQFLNGDGLTRKDHAFMDLGDGTVIEAEPGGARIRPLSEYAPKDVYWCDAIYQLVPFNLRDTVADQGRAMEGIGYSALDYFALAGHRLHLNLLAGFESAIVTSENRLICSQLVDLAYARADVHIFTDNRIPGYVTPGDLYKRDRQIQIWETTLWAAPGLA